jgi:polygalacturonase
MNQRRRESKETSVYKIPRRQFLKQSSLLLALGGTLSARNLFSSDTDVPWSKAQHIVNCIQPPVIPDRTVNVLEFGALAGEASNSLPAFKAAIAECHAAGGGRVIVPAGLWRMDGPIHLRSNMELHLQQGAHIKFSGGRDFYIPLVRTRWEGTELYTYSPMVFGNGLNNVAITGPGIIDGQGRANFLPWRKKQGPDKKALRDMGRNGVPVKERVFGDGHWLRPHFIQLYDCRNVLIDGPTLVDSPFLGVHLVYCDQVIVRRIGINSTHINSDGVDPDSSTNVLIDKCIFNIGDDGVAIKSGRDQDGWRVNRPSKNIVVRNCSYIGNTGGAMAIGSEMSGGVSDVYVENYNIRQANHALYFKANLDRGGTIRRVFIRGIAIGEAATVITFTNSYHGYRGGTYPPHFEDVSIQNVACKYADTALHIIGHPEFPVRNVRLKDIDIDTAKTPFQIRGVDNLIFDNVRINGILHRVADLQILESEAKVDRY